MKKIKKAIIAVAGSGTRLLPATKAMPKEMLPIVNKPIIQLVVEELVEAGIEDIIFVTRWDKKPLEDHFDHSSALESDLRKNGKDAYADEIEQIAEMANFIHVRQKGPYGNGTPVISASSLVINEPFVFVYGDDLVKSKVSFTKQMLDDFEKSGNAMISVQEVPLEMVNRYGVVKIKEGTNIMEDIIEKPSIEEAPSRLAVFGRMIVNQEIVDILKNTPLGKGNELWMTDAFKTYVDKGGIVEVKQLTDGQWLTTGDPLNYLKAILAYAVEDKNLKNELGQYIKELYKNEI